MTPFVVKDCALLTRMSGLPPAINLREMRERIAVCSENVLFHHFCETTLRGTFDNPDYRNDFAVWSKLYLGDRVLAERLGILDPYEFSSLGELRAATLEVIDDRLGESTMIPWARPGDELYFMEATTVVFDTGVRISHAREFAAAIGAMTGGSVYYPLPRSPPPASLREGRLHGVAPRKRGRRKEPSVHRCAGPHRFLFSHPYPPPEGTY